MSKIHISKDEIIDLAHSVIQTMQCEWGDCAVTLNSWNTLAKHLFRHCSNVVSRDGMYECRYSRCAGRLHSTPGALKTHMELSHLSRAAILCPARGCEEVFVRVQQFHSHFEHAHSELINKRLSLDALAPLANLAPPRRLRQPPPLPSNLSRAEFLFAPISIPPRRPSQPSASQSISRKWSRLTVQDDEESDDEPVPFKDLSCFQCDISVPEVVDVEVQSKPLVNQRSLLSRSQPVVYPPVRSTSPKPSILYPVFAAMVDKMVASGTLEEHKGAAKT